MSVDDEQFKSKEEAEAAEKFEGSQANADKTEATGGQEDQSSDAKLLEELEADEHNGDLVKNLDKALKGERGSDNGLHRLQYVECIQQYLAWKKKETGRSEDDLKQELVDLVTAVPQGQFFGEGNSYVPYSREDIIYNIQNLTTSPGLSKRMRTF